jgi:hypothetical protein
MRLVEITLLWSGQELGAKPAVIPIEYTEILAGMQTRFRSIYYFTLKLGVLLLIK